MLESLQNVTSKSQRLFHQICSWTLSMKTVLEEGSIKRHYGSTVSGINKNPLEKSRSSQLLHKQMNNCCNLFLFFNHHLGFYLRCKINDLLNLSQCQYNFFRSVSMLDLAFPTSWPGQTRAIQSILSKRQGTSDKKLKLFLEKENI